VNQAELVTAASGLAVVLGVGYWQNLFSGTQVFYLLAFSAAGYAVYYLYQNDVIGDLDSPFGEEAQVSPLEQSVSFSQMRKDLRRWAEDGYRGDENISIPLDQADFDSKQLQDWDQVLYYVAGALGKSNRPVLIFYEATTGTVTGHKVMRAESDMTRNPFKYSDHYQEYKRRTRGGAGDVQNPMNNMNMYNALMAAQSQNTMPARQNQRSTGGESGDGDEEDE